MKIEAIENGPILIYGRVSVAIGDNVKHLKNSCALCRCGRSENKPFCDGSHAPSYNYGGWEDGPAFEVSE